MRYAKLAKDLDGVLDFLWGIGVQKAFHETVASAIQALLSTDEEIAAYEARLTRLHEIMDGAGCVQMDGYRPTLNDTRVVEELIAALSDENKPQGNP